MTPRSFRILDKAQMVRACQLLMAMPVERPLLLEVADYSEPKTRAQEKLLHSCFTGAHNDIEVEGQRFSAEAWKELYVRQFIGTDDIVLPSGEVIKRRKSTTKLTVAEYNNLIDRVMQALAEDHGYLPQEVA